MLIGDPPSRERRFQALSIRSPRQGSSAGTRPNQEQQRCVGSGDCVDLPSHSGPVRITQPVEALHVQQEVEVRADVRSPQSRHIAFFECHVNPCLFQRCRAASTALGTTSTPTTCQPRSANLTDHRPVPHPRSSADPRGSARASSTSASSWSNSGIIDAASDSHGVKPILYAKRYQRLTMPPMQFISPGSERRQTRGLCAAISSAAGRWP
jgi:hypothetical protein